MQIDEIKSQIKKKKQWKKKNLLAGLCWEQ